MRHLAKASSCGHWFFTPKPSYKRELISDFRAFHPFSESLTRLASSLCRPKAVRPVWDGIAKNWQVPCHGIQKVAQMLLRLGGSFDETGLMAPLVRPN
jgi:hypothetical protein